MVNSAIEHLDELANWMRRRGASRVKCDWPGGLMELELLPVDPSAPAPPAKTPEEVAAALKDARRRRYEIELGRRLTDAELDKLP